MQSRTRTLLIRHQLETAQDVINSGLKRAPAAISTGQFVSVGGLKLHYVNKGSGRPVVLIHGNPGSHQDYSLGVFGQVAQSFHAFAFDRPGHGYSERRDGLKATVEVQARLLRDALRKLSIEKPLLVGHSWGGALALAAAIEYEDELSGLVLLAPAAYPSDSSEWWSILPNVPLLGNLVIKTLTPLIGRGIVKYGLKDAYHPEPVQQDYLRLAEALWTRTERVRACVYDERTLSASLRVLSQHYSEIRLPVVIVTGDSDLLLKPDEHARLLHRTIPGSKLVVLPRTGHQIPQTHPESVIEAIEIAWELTAARNCAA